MPDSRPHLLIAGVTTRALASSAARAGWRVTALDAFGDLDLRAVAEFVPLSRGRTEHFPSDAVAYTSSFENHPDAVERLARGCRLLGNPPAVLRRVRDPIGLMRSLRRRGFATPDTRATPPAGRPRASAWLLKPRRSGGGHGTVPWRGGRAVSRHAYLQERIAGVPGSVVFAADGRRAVTLGLSRQLVGDRGFGAHGFRYCGSLLSAPGAPLFEREPELLEAARALADAVADEFGVVGLNGLDFIARGGVPYPIEVNPRWSASMELVERATGVCLFDLHLAACRGRLPARRIRPISKRVLGKAVVFATRTVTMRDTHPWLDRPALADIPRPGERIARGRPICTVFAEGASGEACSRRLLGEAGRIYRSTGSRTRGAA
ncbi:MAG: ATP-grasp domain-containing protein [Gemmatimonadales bacterium]